MRLFDVRIICVLIASGLFGCTRPDKRTALSQDSPFEMIRSVLRHQDWQRYRHAVLEKRPRRSAAQAALLKALAFVNRTNIKALTDPGSASNHGALHRLRLAAWEYAKKTSASHYLHLGRAIAVDMLDELKRFLKRCSEHKHSVNACIRHKGFGHSPYLDLGGTFAIFALEKNLLSQQSQIPDTPSLLVGIFVNHWARLIEDRTSIHSRLRSDERRWFLMWQLEQDEAAPWKTRLKAAQELSALAEYPVNHNSAVVLAQNGRYQDALKQALKSQHPSSIRLIESIRKKLHANP